MLERLIYITALISLVGAIVPGCAPASDGDVLTPGDDASDLLPPSETSSDALAPENPSPDVVPPGDEPSEEPSAKDTLMIFHNGIGPMCIEALSWLATMQSVHPDLVVEEHMTTDPAGRQLLEQYKAQYGQSQGVSTTFGYLPIIFFGGQAFSGFNEGVQQALEGLIAS